MHGLFFLIPTLIAVFVSLLIVRAAAIALMMTGLDRHKAKFQALSAFTGTGFTTKEAEAVINHPLRRKIISMLMVMGNIGIVTIIVATTSSFANSEGANLLLTALILAAGIFVIYQIATRQGLIIHWENYIEKRLGRSKVFEEEATEDLLHLIEGYGLVKNLVRECSPLVGKSLAEAQLTTKGILVLGVERLNRWIPIPGAHVKIRVDDKLVVYGALDKLHEVLRCEIKAGAPKDGASA